MTYARIYGASHCSAYISDKLVCRDIRRTSSGLRANPVGSRSFSVATLWGPRSLMPILKTPVEYVDPIGGICSSRDQPLSALLITNEALNIFRRSENMLHLFRYGLRTLFRN